MLEAVCHVIIMDEYTRTSFANLRRRSEDPDQGKGRFRNLVNSVVPRYLGEDKIGAASLTTTIDFPLQAHNS